MSEGIKTEVSSLTAVELNVICSQTVDNVNSGGISKADSNRLRRWARFKIMSCYCCLSLFTSHVKN